MNQPKQPKAKNQSEPQKGKDPEARRAHALTEDPSGFQDLYWS